MIKHELKQCGRVLSQCSKKEEQGQGRNRAARKGGGECLGLPKKAPEKDVQTDAVGNLSVKQPVGHVKGVF